LKSVILVTSNKEPEIISEYVGRPSRKIVSAFPQDFRSFFDVIRCAERNISRKLNMPVLSIVTLFPAVRFTSSFRPLTLFTTCPAAIFAQLLYIERYRMLHPTRQKRILRQS